MHIESWQWKNVNKDGTTDGEPGSVNVEPGLKWGAEAIQTASTKASGLFLVMSAGRDWSGRVHGLTVYFDSEDEIADFIARSGVTPNAVLSGKPPHDEL